MEILWFVIIALMGGLTGLGVFLYYLSRGQFEDPEEPKYQMFREDE